MRFGSICSGIEAASVAFTPLGWEAAWFSEIEAFPNAVLKHHYPGVTNYGDMTGLHDRIMSGEVEAPDMICGGPPCQAFSVAGLRQSLNDDRGNLTLEYIRICNATDHIRHTAGKQPAWILYENVPGLLSTQDNAFGAFLGALCGCDSAIPQPVDGWTNAGMVDGPSRCAAWRTLNAEHFGLAQRRKRVFVLALGGAGRWAAADALLPIIESMSWYPAPRREKGKGVAPTVADCLTKCRAGSPDEARGTANLIAHTLKGEGFDAWEDGTGRGVPLVPIARSVAIRGRDGTPQAELGEDIANAILTPNGGRGGIGVGAVLAPMVMAHGQANAEVVSDGSPSLTCNHEAPIVFDPAQVTSVANRSNPAPGDPCHTLHQAAPPLLVRMREGKEGGGKGPLVSKDQSLTLATANDQVLAHFLHVNKGRPDGRKSKHTEMVTVEGETIPTLTTDGHQQSAVAFAQNQLGEVRTGDVLNTLNTNSNASGRNTPMVQASMQVRRLTPRECARLLLWADEFGQWRVCELSMDANKPFSILIDSTKQTNGTDLQDAQRRAQAAAMSLHVS